jgi:hypothetical protein
MKPTQVIALLLIVIARALHVAEGRDLTVTYEELCARGDDPSACRIVELANKIDLKKLVADGRYRFRAGPTALFSIAPRDAKQKQAFLKQAACTFYAEVWIDALVAEYSFLTDERIVDAEKFRICMSTE